MKNILLKMDKLLRKYLGIEQSEITPHVIKKQGDKLIILNSESFKRHINETPISDVSLESMNPDNKKNLVLLLVKLWKII